MNANFTQYIYTIESERLYCRRFTMEDLEGFHGLNGSEEVMKYIRPVTTLEQSEEKLKNCITEYETKPELLRYAVIEKSSNCFAGCFVIFPLENTELIQLGYSFLPEFWGKGFATEITAAGMQYAFEVMGLKEIYAVTRNDHQASQNVLIKNGFSFLKEIKEDEELLHLYKKEK